MQSYRLCQLSARRSGGSQLDIQLLNLTGCPHFETNCWHTASTPTDEGCIASYEMHGSVEACSFCWSWSLFTNLYSKYSQFQIVHCAASVCACVHPPARSPQRAPVRISCPLDTTGSVSMPPIDGRIDPLFDCLDNLCEFQHNASHSGFKDVHRRLRYFMPTVVPECLFLQTPSDRRHTPKGD